MSQNEALTQRLLTAEQGVLGSMLIDEEAVGPMLLAVEEERLCLCRPERKVDLEQAELMRQLRVFLNEE